MIFLLYIQTIKRRLSYPTTGASSFHAFSCRLTTQVDLWQ